MRSRWSHPALLVPLLLGAYLVGQWTRGEGSRSSLSVDVPELAAQGRGGVNPPTGGTGTNSGTTDDEPVVYSEESGQAASGNGLVAVTGSYGVGTSVLYLIDTEKKQLAVYEARGGGNEQRRITLVGARRIDLDLQLEGYNDRSEYGYQDLRKLFERRESTKEVQTGLPVGGTR
ncbi:MAG: hypothetical protein RL148_1153 [Planctomycetota bacterium]|jgi:hypothetical protein